MDDTRRSIAQHRQSATDERGNGRAGHSGLLRPSSPVAVAPTPVGDPDNTRSAARRSLDELMASRLGESRDVWRKCLGPLLERDQVCRLLGAGSGQEIDALVRDKQLLALPTHEGDTVFPAFQFGRNGKPYPVISRVIEILDPVVESPYMIASWLKSRKADLGDRTPIEWLELGRDPRRVVAEARLSAAHLAHS